MNPAVHPTDAALGIQLLDDKALYCLACNTLMVPHTESDTLCVCDPERCGWHTADVRLVAASFRRFQIPPGDVPDTVWVIPITSSVPGIIRRKAT